MIPYFINNLYQVIVNPTNFKYINLHDEVKRSNRVEPLKDGSQNVPDVTSKGYKVLLAV